MSNDPCAPILKPQDYNINVCTGGVTCYDGPALNCVVLPPSPNLNDIIAAIDDAICAAANPSLCASDICWDCVLNLSTCLDAPIAALPPPVDLCDVLNIFAEQICQNQADIAALASSDPGYDGAAPSNYTPTGSAGLNAHFEGIDNELGTLTTGLTGKVAFADLDTRINDITDQDWVEQGGDEASSPVSFTVNMTGTGGFSQFYLGGTRWNTADANVTVAATSDNYIYVKDTDGTYAVASVAIGAPTPVVAGMILWLHTTNGVGVTTTVDLRETYPFNGSSLDDDSIIARHILDGVIGDIKLDVVAVAGTTGDANFFDITITNKGRVTAVTSSINIDPTTLAGDDFLRYDDVAGEWVNVIFAPTLQNVVDNGSTTTANISMTNGADILMDDGNSTGFVSRVEWNPASYIQVDDSGGVNAMSIFSGGNIFFNAASNYAFGPVTSFGAAAVDVIGIGLGTAPTTFPADIVQLWVADRAGAGTASLNIVNEEGETVTIFTDTGWAAPTGTSDKATFDTATVTTENLAEFVKAMWGHLNAMNLLKV